MTNQTRTAYGLAAALCIGPSVAAEARGQAAQSGQTTPAVQAPAPPTRPPGGTTQQPSIRRGSLPQGFSVVLVLGDLQGSATPDDVPPAAKRALTDMKDFLPFKSYKLLDAAWVMCCGQDPRLNALGTQNVIAGHSLGEVVSQLRGPEERTYELRLSASQAEGARVFVRFNLRNLEGEALTEAATAAYEKSSQLSRTMDEIAKLEAQLAEARQKYNANHPEVRKLESELNAVRRRVEMTGRRASGSGRGGGGALGRTMIDTSFTMDVGETVVVGTSRLRGGSQALITMLTAVPPRAK